MKTFALCGVLGGLAFAFMGYQMDLFTPQSPVDEEEVEAKAEKKTPRKRAVFPDALARNAGTEGVPEAAGYLAANKIHKVIFLRPNGEVHPWNDKIDEKWAAESVEETELALVIRPQTKVKLETKSFANGPPIERMQWNLDVFVVDAKSGEVLATRRFQNQPRPVNPVEPYALTMIGAPVSCTTVFNWFASASRNGFLNGSNDRPIITTID